MMKLVWFCVLFGVFGTAFLADAMRSNGNTATSRAAERMLKADRFAGSHGHGACLDDYQPVDPSPSSKAVRPGPIQHGTPMIPYIPRPSPPNQPRFASPP